MAKKKAVKVKKEDEDGDFWSDDDLKDESLNEETDDVVEDPKKELKFVKIKELKEGMEDVNVEGTVDFIGEVQGKEYGEQPRATGFIKDETGEVRITFWGDDIKKAKQKKAKVRIIKAAVRAFRGDKQLYPSRKNGVEFF